MANLPAILVSEGIKINTGKDTAKGVQNLEGEDSRVLARPEHVHEGLAHEQADVDTNCDCYHRASDVDAVPYIQAIVKETLRWHIITPMGIPHVAVEDDEYNGYHIPAGTVISPNLWYASSDDSQS